MVVGRRTASSIRLCGRGPRPLHGLSTQLGMSWHGSRPGLCSPARYRFRTRINKNRPLAALTTFRAHGLIFLWNPAQRSERKTARTVRHPIVQIPIRHSTAPGHLPLQEIWLHYDTRNNLAALRSHQIVIGAWVTGNRPLGMPPISNKSGLHLPLRLNHWLWHPRPTARSAFLQPIPTRRSKETTCRRPSFSVATHTTVEPSDRCRYPDTGTTMEHGSTQRSSWFLCSLHPNEELSPWLWSRNMIWALKFYW
mmetsp:Transcript_448/g.910  ORF Transcript_448/g.910 Transcript_448/m.910 type:complete len:252 (+) Transcript_448:687-1442(+)